MNTGRRSRRSYQRTTINATAILAAPVVMNISAPTHADEGGRPVTAEVGLSYLANGASRRSTSDSGFHLGLGLELKTKPLLAPNRSTPSLNFHFDRVDGRGNTINNVGFMYTEKIALSKEERKPGHSPGVWYFGLGVGLSYLDGTGPAPGSGGTPSGGSNPTGGSNPNEQIAQSHRGRAAGGTVSESKLVGGARVLLGVDLTSRMYVEGAYNITGSVVVIRASSFNLSVGYRF